MRGTGEEASDATRKRLAVEMAVRHENALRRTARRFSLCAEDGEDAFQRALEIFLLKAPEGEAHELVRWMHTVIKHEALAIRRSRERQLGAPPVPASAGEEADWVALIPAAGDGPEERVERKEAIARSREALKTLKPAELRALTLLAEGYSYSEIGAMTGFSATKVNRCLAEGRERFRSVLSRSENGSRCAELRPLLSAFCDGEAGPDESSAVREHLRACAHCRAAMRTYRVAPRAAAALAPVPIATPSLLDRFHEAIAAVQARLPGQPMATTDSTVTQVAAAGGTRGAGVAALAKVLAICAGTAGGAAACVTAGVVPGPLGMAGGHSDRPVLERAAGASAEAAPEAAVEEEAPATPAPQPEKPVEDTPAAEKQEAPVEAAPPPAEAGAVEYTPPPAPAPVTTSSSASSGTGSGSAAGEFGP